MVWRSIYDDFGVSKITPTLFLVRPELFETKTSISL